MEYHSKIGRKYCKDASNLKIDIKLNPISMNILEYFYVKINTLHVHSKAKVAKTFLRNNTFRGLAVRIETTLNYLNRIENLELINIYMNT